MSWREALTIKMWTTKGWVWIDNQSKFSDHFLSDSNQSAYIMPNIYIFHVWLHTTKWTTDLVLYLVTSNTVKEVRRLYLYIIKVTSRRWIFAYNSFWPYSFDWYYISTIFPIIVLSTHNSCTFTIATLSSLKLTRQKIYPQTKAFTLESGVESCTRSHRVACTFVVIKLMCLVHHRPQTSANLQPTVKEAIHRCHINNTTLNMIFKVTNSTWLAQIPIANCGVVSAKSTLFLTPCELLGTF